MTHFWGTAGRKTRETMPTTRGTKTKTYTTVAYRWDMKMALGCITSSRQRRWTRLNRRSKSNLRYSLLYDVAKRHVCGRIKSVTKKIERDKKCTMNRSVNNRWYSLPLHLISFWQTGIRHPFARKRWSGGGFAACLRPVRCNYNIIMIRRILTGTRNGILGYIPSCFWRVCYDHDRCTLLAFRRLDRSCRFQRWLTRGVPELAHPLRSTLESPLTACQRSVMQALCMQTWHNNHVPTLKWPSLLSAQQLNTAINASHQRSNILIQH